MTFLSRSFSLDPNDPVVQLLSLQDAEALRAAMNALAPTDAARAVGQAPSLEEKSRLVWALAPHLRREVLDHLHPGFVAALIQNREEENKRLLSSLSREQFTRLLRFCSPEQAYYWLSLAVSFDEARANMLPLLIPVDDLATALLTEPEFRSHCDAIGGADMDDVASRLPDLAAAEDAYAVLTWPDGREEEYPLRDGNLDELREDLEGFEDAVSVTIRMLGADGRYHECALPMGGAGAWSLENLRADLSEFKDMVLALLAVFGPDRILKEYPVRTPRLRRLLQTILDHDPEHYAALIHAAIEVSDYRDGHPEEPEVVSDDPVLLKELLTPEEERARAGLTPSNGTPGDETHRRVAPSPPRPVVPQLPVQRSGELMRAAMGTLPAPRRAELSEEMQLLFLQEAAYAGGSFAQADLESAAGRVQTYVQMGLSGLAGGDAEAAAKLLADQRLRTLMESGARHVERMRQVALRLLPWREVLDPNQVRLLESLIRPRVGVDAAGQGQPVLFLRPLPKSRETGTLPLEAVPGQLEAIGAWVTLVRAVGKEHVACHLPNRTAADVARLLVVAALLYRRWEADLDPETGCFTPAAYQALAEATRDLALRKKLTPRATEEIVRLLAQTLDELAGGA
jgi:hypothetical protein